jgi:hypothetical protein
MPCPPIDPLTSSFVNRHSCHSDVCETVAGEKNVPCDGSTVGHGMPCPYNECNPKTYRKSLDWASDLR